MWSPYMFPGYRALYAYMHCPLADAQRSSVPHCPIRPPSPSPPSPPPARSPSAPVCACLHSATDMCRHAQTDRHTQISTDKHRHVRLLPSALVRSRPLSSALVCCETDRHRHRQTQTQTQTQTPVHSRPADSQQAQTSQLLCVALHICKTLSLNVCKLLVSLG